VPPPIAVFIKLDPHPNGLEARHQIFLQGAQRVWV